VSRPETPVVEPGASDANANAVVIAGLAAGIAYAAVQEVDLRLTGRNVDDLAVLGRPFARERRRARLLGIVLHLANGVALAFVYSKVQHRLPGPPAVRGVIFANAENAILYPVTVFEDRHPGIREGSIARYRTWPSFVQSIPRHIVYGAVLGALYARLGGRDR
jgi:hypothetical protein